MSWTKEGTRENLRGRLRLNKQRAREARDAGDRKAMIAAAFAAAMMSVVLARLA